MALPVSDGSGDLVAPELKSESACVDDTRVGGDHTQPDPLQKNCKRKEIHR